MNNIQNRPGRKAVRINPIKLKEWRKSEYMSQIELAQELETTVLAVGQWERNERFMSLKMAKRFEEIYGFDPIETFGIFDSNEKISERDQDKPVNGLHLRTWRTFNEITQYELADYLGCSLNTPSQWENGKKNMTIENQQKFEEKFGFNPTQGFPKILGYD